MNNNRDPVSFSPVLGGSYYSGNFNNETTVGNWWSSEAYNGALRDDLLYKDGVLSTVHNGRNAGYYIRCVQKS